MKLDDLRKAIESHSGTFICKKINEESASKEVEFHHKFDNPTNQTSDLPIEQLSDFYETFSNLLLYHDQVSDESAIYIGSPDEWDSLESDFLPWLDCLDEDALPSWIDDCLVIGEVPQSGNYLLLPLSGEKRGYVFEFEHDGFEFIELAPDIEKFIYQLLDPSASTLAEMSSHMRFVEGGDYTIQWWIVEMHDNRGNAVQTFA